MSKSLKETLERLNKMTSQKRGASTGKKIKYWKAKPGKNEIIVLPLKGQEDPFLEWGEHQGLLEPNYLSIPCSEFNEGEPCQVCEIVKELKAENWKGNKEIWSPIELKKRYYSPVIDLNEIEAGIQWYSYGQTVLSQFQTWLLNLEEDETPFYDIENIERVIVNYDPEKDAALRYKLDKKSIKKLPEELEDLEGIVEGMDSLPELLNQYKRSDDSIAQIIDDYLRKITETLDDDDDKEEGKSDKKKDDSKKKVDPKKKDKEEEDDDDDDDDSDDKEEEKSSKKKVDPKKKDKEEDEDDDDEDDEDKTPSLRKLRKKD